MPVDAAIKWQLDVLRFDAGTRKKVMPILKRLQRELVGQLAEGPTDWSRRRLEAMLAETNESIAKHYDEINEVVEGAVKGVAPVASRAAASGMQASVPIRLGVGLPTVTHMKAIAGDAIIQGAPLKAWWEKQAADTAFKYAAEVRQGITAGESTQKIVRRIVGGKGQAGVMDISRRNAATLVQTSIQSVANEARAETFRENADVIKEYRVITALDQSVCFECAGYADQVFDDIDDAPPYPLHPNCRCVVVATSTLADEYDIPEGTRASQFGQVTASTTFEEFLGRQSPEFKDRVLGPGRAELFTSGKISLRDLTDGDGKPLTLAELRAKYA